MVGHVLLLLIVTVLMEQTRITTGVRKDGDRLICLDTCTRFHSTQVSELLVSTHTLDIIAKLTIYSSQHLENIISQLHYTEEPTWDTHGWRYALPSRWGAG